MIFNKYSKLQKQLLYKQFKYITLPINNNKKQINFILKSKNSNFYTYTKFIYKYIYIKSINVILINYIEIFNKSIIFWYILLFNKHKYNIKISLIFYIFSYF